MKNKTQKIALFAAAVFSLFLLLSCDYTFRTPSVTEIQEVVFFPDGGEVEKGAKITLSCPTSGVSIWYSTKPNFYPFNFSTAGTQIAQVPFKYTVEESVTLYALAVDSNGNTSKRTQAAYTVKTETTDPGTDDPDNPSTDPDNPNPNPTPSPTPTPSDPTNANANDASLGDYVTLLSSAKINTANKYVAHTVSYNGQTVMNYNFEWNSNLKHAVWSGFYFDKDLIKNGSGVKRNNPFKSDPIIPDVKDSHHTSDGYARGHIIASADRFYDQTANNQTFYYTNMSPQIPDFNQGFWQKVEDKVRDLSQNALNSGYSKVHITKGGDTKTLLKNWRGTKAQNNIYPTADANGFSSKGLAVPSAYYTVMLAEKDEQDNANPGNYITLGFYIPHVEGLPNGNNATHSEMQKYVYTIDEIEEKTGVDFFCNLLDSVENEVEARTKETCIANWNW